MQIIINNGTFPNPLAPKNLKDQKEFGMQVAKAILASTQEYRKKRNEIFSSNRAYAEGRQSLKPLLDMMEVGGQSVYTNISVRPGMYAKKFEKIVVDGYMTSKNEYPKVTALSKHIEERKEKRKSDAAFRMEYKDLLAQLSQEAGMPIEDPNEFVPSSKEELDIYSELNDKEKEEILLQQTLTFVLNEVGIETLKRRILTDLFQVNLYGLYEYIDNTGRECVDYIQGEDCIYSNSFFDDFKDITYAGRIIRMPVSKLRSRFTIEGKDEKDFYNSLKKFTGKFGNRAVLPTWKDDYRFSDTRPYDNFTVEVLHVWWQCNKVLEYTEGKDRYGRSIFDTSYNVTLGDVLKSEGRKKLGRVYPLTAYEGYFLNDTCLCLEWGEQRNQVRDGLSKEELINPFIFHMVDNHGGMLSPSPIESIKDNIQMMDLQILKIKQVIAKTAPPGLAIDVKALMAVKLGDGEETADPLTLASIYRQTGDIFYVSTDEQGKPLGQAPIRPSPVQLGDQINTYVALFNQAQDNIRGILGVNEFRDGSASAPRTGFRFAQSQLDASNTATISLYMAYVKGITKFLRQAGIRIWDSLKYGTANKGYRKNLGLNNAKLIEAKDEIIQSIYDFKYEMGMSSQERELLEANIQACLANGTIEMPDALLTRRTADSSPLLAERMLSFLYEKRRKQRMEETDRASQMQAMSAAEAGKQVEQAKGQNIQLQMQADELKERTKGEAERDRGLETLVWDLIRQEQLGNPIPPVYMPLVQQVLQNRGLVISQETSQREQQIQAQEQQQYAMDELEMAVEQGEISPEEAQGILNQGAM